ncbi:hypothetical protein PVAP13_9NG561500 [Panicum virgatum]|uniref:Uncharacterized protein n=1 Tax=Panicum virgatum TaxID=38727 RepID=A0A8T0MY77_PANVG|nr:hypothetical protein PVAP13_9NG561500 [Panicum virgatum]
MHHTGFIWWTGSSSSRRRRPPRPWPSWASVAAQERRGAVAASPPARPWSSSAPSPAASPGSGGRELRLRRIERGRGRAPADGPRSPVSTPSSSAGSRPPSSGAATASSFPARSSCRRTHGGTSAGCSERPAVRLIQRKPARPRP